MVESVAASARDIDQIGRRGTYTACTVAVAIEVCKTVFEVAHDFFIESIGQAGKHQRIVHSGNVVRHPDGLSVQISAGGSFPRIETFAEGHLMHHADHGFTCLGIPQRNADGIRRQTVHKIGRTVERIDNPLPRSLFIVSSGTLFGNKAGFGQEFGQSGYDHLFGTLVDIGDEIEGSLNFDLVGRKAFTFGSDIVGSLSGDLPHTAAYLFPIGLHHNSFFYERAFFRS